MSRVSLELPRSAGRAPDTWCCSLSLRRTPTSPGICQSYDPRSAHSTKPNLYSRRCHKRDKDSRTIHVLHTVQSPSCTAGDAIRETKIASPIPGLMKLHRGMALSHAWLLQQVLEQHSQALSGNARQCFHTYQYASLRYPLNLTHASTNIVVTPCSGFTYQQFSLKISGARDQTGTPYSGDGGRGGL
jgi:hypothetical protein